jgi:Rrf2 family protein
MISQTAEYALRAVVQLSGGADSSQTTREIAELTRVPKPYLSKVMQGLTRAGIVRPHRGIRGGFTLVKAPADITVYDVIQAVDPIRRIEACPLGLIAHGRNLCPLHRRLDNAIGLVEEAFRASSLADMLTDSAPGLCAPERPEQPTR